MTSHGLTTGMLGPAMRQAAFVAVILLSTPLRQPRERDAGRQAGRVIDRVECVAVAREQGHPLRAEQALGGYLGDLNPVRNSIDVACRLIESAQSLFAAFVAAGDTSRQRVADLRFRRHVRRRASVLQW
jgi:hypothetical protein